MPSHRAVAWLALFVLGLDLNGERVESGDAGLDGLVGVDGELDFDFGVADDVVVLVVFEEDSVEVVEGVRRGHGGHGHRPWVWSRPGPFERL